MPQDAGDITETAAVSAVLSTQLLVLSDLESEMPIAELVGKFWPAGQRYWIDIKGTRSRFVHAHEIHYVMH